MFGPGPTAAAGRRPGGQKGLLDNYDDVEGYYNFQVRPAVLWHFIHDFTLVTNRHPRLQAAFHGHAPVSACIIVNDKLIHPGGSTLCMPVL